MSLPPFPADGERNWAPQLRQWGDALEVAVEGHVDEVLTQWAPDVLAAGADAITARDQTIALRDEVQVISGLTGEDEAVAFLAASSGTALREALDGGYRTRAPLDIWPEYFRNGSGSESWDGTTYADFIAGVDARLAGTGAVKEQIGTCTDGQPIFAYTAGAEGRLHALLIGGTHAIESTSLFAAMRYFTEFADNPAMAGRRDVLRITWIPVLTPSAYMTARYNSAGIDPNRDLDFFWEYWDGVDEHPRGPEAMSQPSSQALKHVLDTKPIACVVDCHTGHEGLGWQGPSTWTLGNRAIAYNAGSRWNQTYNAAGTVVGSPYGTGREGRPQTINWANQYMLSKGRENAAALLIESMIPLGGSVSLASLSGEGARLYCGMIDTFLTEWLEAGQANTQPLPRTMVARRFISDSATSIGDGGTLITVNPVTPITFNEVQAHVGVPGAPWVNFMDVPMPGRGTVKVEAFAEVAAIAENPASATAVMHIGYGASPVEGGDVAFPGPGKTRQSVAPGEYGSLSAITRFPVTGPQLMRFQLGFGNDSFATRLLRVTLCSLTVTWYPETDIYRSPQVDVSNRT